MPSCAGKGSKRSRDKEDKHDNRKSHPERLNGSSKRAKRQLPPHQLLPSIGEGRPELPEGWDRRIENNRVFYVDTYARGAEQRCFWKPPIRELDDHARALPGWQKVTNVFGRIHWVHAATKIDSYARPVYINGAEHGALLICDKEGNESIYCRCRDVECWEIDDANVACQIEASVWDHGISDEAVKVRGELWWGNPCVNEMNLRRTPMPDRKTGV
ncbi:hypothetical protein NA57DRAFT_61683 [Rhizodiscina lignyota]|uniref:Uncharacterized protein n=1 Tax=Rhizodiscina lignyota TaxID=1504668 RepID=A0A9P4M019_9PEZI|nr:hypothetical protein NA57DRAFT_61683 [Rhizodiscina lignyota]